MYRVIKKDELNSKLANQCIIWTMPCGVTRWPVLVPCVGASQCSEDVTSAEEIVTSISSVTWPLSTICRLTLCPGPRPASPGLWKYCNLIQGGRRTGGHSGWPCGHKTFHFAGNFIFCTKSPTYHIKAKSIQINLPDFFHHTDYQKSISNL